MTRLARLNLRPFTPSREQPEALVDRTVGRDALLDTILRRLRAAATTGNRSHTLLVGPRGSGKTHALDVTLHRLRRDRVLSERLAVARVDEDVVGIVTYADLILHIHGALGLAPEPEVRPSRDVAAAEAAISAHLGGRVLVVVVENLARVFESLGTAGQRNLRSFVETSGQVVLLASTPLLFKGIVSRSDPWFGSFAIEHLPELTLDEGIELLRRLAVEDDDGDVADYVGEPQGRARLAALHHLAGGSPRLWMILAGCASIELLDDLVPAVEELLERLVPYYQQRLWELPGNEQKLIRELGTGPPSATVADLAARCGLDERTAASALGRLAEAGWVRSEKLPGTDQRKSWYRLREPLLRHHFQYRQADGEPLRLIVDILRLWFDPAERRTHLAGVRPTSPAERHLLATFSLDPPQRSDSAYADRDVDRLLGEVRWWIDDPGSIGSSAAGVLLEAVIVAVKTSTRAGRRVLEDRHAPESVCRAAEDLFAQLETMSPTMPAEDRTGRALDAAADASEPSLDQPVLTLVAACWNGALDPSRAVGRLAPLLDANRPDRLMLTLRDEHAYWLKEAGRTAEALAEILRLVEDRIRVHGDDHPDTLVSRCNLAHCLGEAGRVEEAVAGYSGVVQDMVRMLGASHRFTRMAQRSQVRLLLRIGRYGDAVRLTVASVDGLAGIVGDGEAASREAAEDLLEVLVDQLRRGLSVPTVDPPTSRAAGEILALVDDMEAARDGSAEAAAGLPPALRSLIEGLAPDPVNLAPGRVNDVGVSQKT